jgi:hypothetical protein
MPDACTLLPSVGVALPSLAGSIDKRWSNERDGQAAGLLIFVNTRSGRECGKRKSQGKTIWGKTIKKLSKKTI